MGKGARNRALRKQADTARQDGLTSELLDALLALDDFDGFSAFLNARSGLITNAVKKDLREMARAEIYGVTFARLLTLINRARTDPELAWANYAAHRARVKQLESEIDRCLVEMGEAAQRQQYDDVIALAEEAFPLAAEAGHGGAACSLRHQHGLALLQRSSPSRDEDLETAIALLEEALTLVLSGEAPDILMHLALVYSERLRGDRRENVERAVELLRAALNELGDNAPPDTLAIVRTNLATVLIRREAGDRIQNLREAVVLCELALTYRSVTRNAVDWAFSQLNLGEALENLAAEGAEDPAKARNVYKRLLDEHEALGDDVWLVGGAHQALGGMLLRAADVSVEDIVDAEEGQLETLFDTDSVLREARSHLESAQQLMSGAPNPIRRARVLNDLSEVLSRLHENDLAIAAAREAFQTLRPTTAPRQCRDVGARLGSLLADRGQWREAATAYRDAVEAAELMFHGRLETASREDEMRHAGNLFRWAAFAAAKAGEATTAALILENGRAREIRRRLGIQPYDEERLSALPSDLRRQYKRVVRRVTRAPMTETGSEAARQLQEVLVSIRAQAGFRDFATGVRAQDLRNAVEPRWPLIYVNPTPHGTVLLRVSAVNQSIAVSSILLDDVTSTDVFMRLLGGDRADAEDDDDERLGTSYLFAIASDGRSESDVADGLDEMLPWLGERLARPISRCAADVDAIGVTLVPCGPLGATPLHAASWRTAKASHCLLDDLHVRYTPSAALAATSLRRASRRARSPRLVALGNPAGDLPAAGPEVAEIARLFPAESIRCALGTQANKAYLRSCARHATHLHLACHATGALLDATDTGVQLSDGVVSAPQLTELGGVETRVVAISACQSALSELSGLPDEAFSIAAAMVVSGSACSVATLWSVHDFPTALLMVRFYEGLLIENLRPPEALRLAQLWLRDLTEQGAHAFLDKHPALADELRQRRDRAQPTLLRGPVTGSDQSVPRPYSHPDFWAPFIAVGA